MAHKIAKLILEKATTPTARVEAVKTALQMGMPLNEVEEYLDWLDMMRGLSARFAEPPDDEPPDEEPPDEVTDRDD
ncbi:MAG: hypothetical protein JJ992_01740 [Planctomycetes bacterium]|nr:hypothetical protein [Planctomycetota bacterium]